MDVMVAASDAPAARTNRLDASILFARPSPAAQCAGLCIVPHDESIRLIQSTCKQLKVCTWLTSSEPLVEAEMPTPATVRPPSRAAVGVPCGMGCAHQPPPVHGLPIPQKTFVHGRVLKPSCQM